MKEPTSLRDKYYSAQEWSKRAKPENQSLKLHGKIDPLEDPRSKNFEKLINK